MLKKRHLSFCSYSLNLKTANLKTHENKQTKVHVLMGVDYLCLSMCKGAWRFLRLKISNRWSRLIFLYNMHIGKMIEEELRRQERTVTWLAKHLCCERTKCVFYFQKRKYRHHSSIPHINNIKKELFYAPIQRDRRTNP